MAIVHAAIATPLISYLYDPSKRYVNYRRRTVQHLRRENELRILVCVHEEESIFGLLNLLKATFPTIVSPLGIYVLDLLKLEGREHPLLINHQFHNRSSSNATRTARIISAFQHYQIHHEGMVKNQYYTAITPYDSMHGDICTLALQKITTLIIVPFEKSESNPVRGIKRKLLDKAPCSVGILVDKKILTYFRINESKYHVCVVFTGGPDSREALAYGARMVENLNTRLTVIRLIAEDEFITNLIEAKLDMKAIADLSGVSRYSDRVNFREINVRDGAETSRVLMSLDDNIDFILVGRRVDEESPLVSGLVEWANHFQELGILGDILASSDMKSNASVLVFQQQFTVEDLMPQLK